jgi:hypothetical protein
MIAGRSQGSIRPHEVAWPTSRCMGHGRGTAQAGAVKCLQDLVRFAPARARGGSGRARPLHHRRWRPQAGASGDRGAPAAPNKERGSRTNVRCRAVSGRSSVTVKKKRSAATDPLMLGGSYASLCPMQLKTAKILRHGRIRRTAQEGCERPHVPDIVVARLLDEVAHRHVFDHASAQRADGLLTHLGFSLIGVLLS